MIMWFEIDKLYRVEEWEIASRLGTIWQNFTCGWWRDEKLQNAGVWSMDVAAKTCSATESFKYEEAATTVFTISLRNQGGLNWDWYTLIDHHSLFSRSDAYHFLHHPHDNIISFYINTLARILVRWKLIPRPVRSGIDPRGPTFKQIIKMKTEK